MDSLHLDHQFSSLAHSGIGKNHMPQIYTEHFYLLCQTNTLISFRVPWSRDFEFLTAKFYSNHFWRKKEIRRGKKGKRLSATDLWRKVRRFHTGLGHECVIYGGLCQKRIKIFGVPGLKMENRLFLVDKKT